jgi:hypothetical protein
MIAFVVEHDVSVTEKGKQIVKDLLVGIHRVEAIKPFPAVSGPEASPVFIYAGSAESAPPPMVNL